MPVRNSALAVFVSYRKIAEQTHDVAKQKFHSILSRRETQQAKAPLMARQATGLATEASGDLNQTPRQRITNAAGSQCAMPIYLIKSLPPFNRTLRTFYMLSNKDKKEDKQERNKKPPTIQLGWRL